MDTREMLSQAMELPRSKLIGKEKLAELERWDSLALLNFMALVDANCQITLSADGLLKCESIAEVEKLITEARSRSDESVHQRD
ncbi:MAG: hypothetical protein JWO19_1257 [Bryobacterales bacterium]|jgi:acyl carrier protein|nr:hypothetical protein [Bryobacterales bacterium]